MREMLSEYFTTLLTLICGFAIAIIFITVFFGPNAQISDVVSSYIEELVKWGTYFNNTLVQLLFFRLA